MPDTNPSPDAARLLDMKNALADIRLRYDRRRDKIQFLAHLSPGEEHTRWKRETEAQAAALNAAAVELSWQIWEAENGSARPAELLGERNTPPCSPN